METEKKYTALKLEYSNKILINARKDDKIDNLGKQVDFIKQHHKQKQLYLEYCEIFSADEINSLQNVGDDKRNDSAFVNKIIQFLYKNDTEKLLKTSLTGASKQTNVQKLQMSPEKKTSIYILVKQRLKSFNLPQNEYMKRSNNGEINRLICNGLLNNGKFIQQNKSP